MFHKKSNIISEDLQEEGCMRFHINLVKRKSVPGSTESKRKCGKNIRKMLVMFQMKYFWNHKQILETELMKYFMNGLVMNRIES